MLQSNNNVPLNADLVFLSRRENENKKKIDMLQVNKTARYTDIPTKIIKESSDLVSDFIFSNFNDFIAQSVFPIALKLADVRLTNKKDSQNSKENYRLVSILTNFSKIYRKFMFNKISEYFDLSSQNFSVGLERAKALNILFHIWSHPSSTYKNFSKN